MLQLMGSSRQRFRVGVILHECSSDGQGLNVPKYNLDLTPLYSFRNISSFGVWIFHWSLQLLHWDTNLLPLIQVTRSWKMWPQYKAIRGLTRIQCRFRVWKHRTCETLYIVFTEQFNNLNICFPSVYLHTIHILFHVATCLTKFTVQTWQMDRP